MKQIKVLTARMEHHLHLEAKALMEHIALHSYLPDADADTFVKTLSGLLLRRPQSDDEEAAIRRELMKILPCEEESWACLQAAELILGIMRSVLRREYLDGSCDLLADERALTNFRIAVSICLEGNDPSWYRSPDKAVHPRDWGTEELLA